MENRQMLKKLCTQAIIPIALGAAFPTGSALAASDGAIATVTIAGVHYTLPQHSFGDIERVELNPSNPLCHVYQYYYMMIMDRELFINGVRAYKARPGDHVVVSYVAGGDYWRAVRVNGRPAPRQPEKTLALGQRSCASLDNGEPKRIVRRAPRL
jgi:hypothetical protein